ncbi:hypothetical protein [Hymenobacter jejuensis]|uniref:Lipocalin-like domain-containing protein n=1 Tax=Hymenobacter jejuensis TaxID=2502781 RepID=A0A5B8A2M5_9BACT|nr:hypothetical protein [Hymenobacter jejuensis]QDA61540.1 hypothetical protein FHG12_16185 [Hymenobacter jejuensis]
MKKLSLFLSLAALASLAACEKETVELKEPSAPAANAQASGDALTGSNWHLTALTGTWNSGTGPITTDVLFTVKPYTRDNQIQYNADGTYVENEGATKGNPADPQQISGTWKLSTTRDSLTVTLPGVVRRYAVTELSPTALRLTETNGVDKAKATTFTSVFTH